MVLLKEGEMNLKGFLYLVLLDWRVKQISLLQNFWKSFTFLLTLLLYQKTIKRDFWEASVLSKCLYIFYDW